MLNSLNGSLPADKSVNIQTQNSTGKSEVHLFFHVPSKGNNDKDLNERNKVAYGQLLLQMANTPILILGKNPVALPASVVKVSGENQDEQDPV